MTNPVRSTLRLYTQPSAHAELSWEWVAQQLAAAGTYWVIAVSPGHPHPRPVWGLWHQNELYLSLGSPALRAALAADPRVTVHLESGTDVVIVEGSAQPPVATSAELLTAYDAKYDWQYDAGAYGDLLRIAPSTIIAWKAAGWAGRESFQETGRWEF